MSFFIHRINHATQKLPAGAIPPENLEAFIFPLGYLARVVSLANVAIEPNHGHVSDDVDFDGADVGVIVSKP